MYKCSVCHDSKKMAGIGYMIVDCEFCLKDEFCSVSEASLVSEAKETSKSDISVKASKRATAYKEAVKELMTSLNMSKAEAEALLDKS